MLGIIGTEKNLNYLRLNERHLCFPTILSRFTRPFYDYQEIIQIYHSWTYMITVFLYKKTGFKLLPIVKNTRIAHLLQILN